MADVKNYALNSTPEMEKQIQDFANSAAFSNSIIRVMPDGHSGKGCVVGTTIKYTDKIVPNVVGVDIACRVSMFNIGNKDIVSPKFLKDIDETIHRVVPAGTGNVNDSIPKEALDIDYSKLKCYDSLNKIDYLKRSIGSLGSGNHYIELDISEKNNGVSLVIHCGSRNLGVQVCDYYQNKAVEARDKRIFEYYEHTDAMVKFLRDSGQVNKIQPMIEFRKNLIAQEPSNDLCYLTGEDMEDYLNDMAFCNLWSGLSHIIIANKIIEDMNENGYNLNNELVATNIHNYVDVDNGIIRKGAIDASFGNICLIPLNMRDGILVGVGKGNDDWNCSAPHGAGRLMSRSEARKNIDINEYSDAMDGIYSTCVKNSTIDEAPQAYKSAKEIEEAIKPTVDVYDHLYPIYNFKGTN